MCRTASSATCGVGRCSSLTSAGHDASSGKVMSYRMEPQRHPPLILSGRVDMFFRRFTSVAATQVEDTLVCCLSLSLLLFCSVHSHALLYVGQICVALVVAWAPSELVLHRPKLCLRVRVRFAWLPPQSLPCLSHLALRNSFRSRPFCLEVSVT